MPRPERELDPQADPLHGFAHELRELRREAGEPGYRELADRTRFSASALAAAARGERLPSLQVTLAYVDACGGDRDAWKRRWEDLRRLLTEETSDAPDAEPPYLGLSRYEAGDAGRFFGRDALVDEIVARTRRDRFVAVFGPSGSGKSSLLRAGVVPRLGLDATVVTPGEHGTPPPDAELLVVDQFEEVFTLRPDAADRHAFIDAVLARRGRTVIAVRADFYGRCAEHPELVAALRDAGVLVGSMRGEELREAIVKPAAAEGLVLEPALMARVIQDAGTEPGALPLVSHAMLETWRRRRGKTLTLAGYEAAGGVHGAIADTAEDIYQRLSGPDRRAVRRLMTRLVTVGDTAPELSARRPVGRAELDGALRCGALVERLARARLVTLHGDEVEIAHEALIRTWPRLREWLARDREGLRLHARLAAAAAEWDAIGRDEGSLYQGPRLTMAAEWAETHGEDLGPLERDFLDASSAAHRRRTAAAERRTRVLQGLVSALSVLLLVAVASGGLALSERAEADEQRRLARSRQLAAEAVARLPTDVSGAARSAAEAYRTAPTLDARSAVLSIAARRPYQARLTGHAGMVKAVAIRPDGAELATGGQDGTVILWDGRARTETGRLRPDGGAVRALEYSPDGALLAAADLAGGVTLWRASDKARVARLQTKGVLDGLAFSPDGRLVAASGAAKKTVVWETSTGRKVDELGGYGGKMTEVAFAPDGRRLAIADKSGRVALWTPRTGDGEPEPAEAEMLNVSDAPLYAVAFSPDGRRLAAAGEDSEVHLWDLPGRRPLKPKRRLAHAAPVRALAFTDGGRTLISAGYDRVAKLWDTGSQTAVTELTGHTSGLYDVAAAPDGGLIATAAADQSALIRDRRTMPYTGHTGWVNAVSLVEGGRAAVSADQDGAVRWWDTRDHRPADAPATGGKGGLGAMDTAASGRTVATGGDDGTIRIWQDRRLAATLEGHTQGVRSIAFAPDGRTLAAADHSGAVIWWDLAARRPVATLKRGRPLVGDVAFSPDGRTLVTGGDDRALTFWDLGARRPVARVTGHAGDVEEIDFSPDGRLLASGGGDGRVLLWDARSRRRTGVLAGHTAEIRAIEFGASGDRLASASLDRSVVVWDVPGRTRWATLTGHTDLVLGLSFGRDGRTLLSSSGDQTITAWDLAPDRAAASLRTLSR
ncbi:hypothetical protein E1264_27760 [Actinomadura sp. KC216]|uniref:nSTAND1 domain-containing NTPase n=1 Tax=Actinomadura sp. KC216 TaxID=2530370 RepID=UPI00104F0EF9|nr:hypothetical protein [Actinomadura sp. KC216]TDB83607.1 hypothetical protein E1264_27760 [Actinomadura sp. KC216]